MTPLYHLFDDGVMDVEGSTNPKKLWARARKMYRKYTGHVGPVSQELLIREGVEVRQTGRMG